MPIVRKLPKLKKEKKMEEKEKKEVPMATDGDYTCTITMKPTGTVDLAHNLGTKAIRPRCGQVAQLLPANLRADVEYTISRLGWDGPDYLPNLIQRMWGVIPAQMWATAFIQVAKALNSDNPVTVTAPVAQPPVFVAWGDTLYRLTPDSKIAVNDELAAMRARIESEMATQSKLIIDKAEAKKDAILATANKLNMEIQNRVAQARAELTTMRKEMTTLPPKWLAASPYAYRHNGHQWVAHLPVALKITRFDYNKKSDFGTTCLRKSWKALHAPNIHFTTIVPIPNIDASEDAMFNLTALTCDLFLPHFAPGVSCAAIGDAPKTITNADDLSRLASAISRVFSIVDLNSLAIGTFDWDPSVWAFVPPELATILKSTYWQEEIPGAIKADDKTVETITIESERKETWTA